MFFPKPDCLSGSGANCPKYIGREPGSLSRLGDNRAGLMLNNRFTCEGFIKEIQYFRGDPEPTAYVGIWRQISNDEFILKHEIVLPADVIGIHTIMPQVPIRVDRGDFLGVHYDEAQPQGVIVYSIPEDGVLRHQELFQTQSVEIYRANIRVNQTIRLREWASNLGRKTYALKAVMEYIATAGGIDPSRLTHKGYGFDRPLVPNDTEENMQHNRRTEIYIRPSAEGEDLDTGTPFETP